MSDVVCGLLARGGFDRGAQGVLGAGRRLADGLGGKLHAIVVGPADDALSSGAAAVADGRRDPVIGELVHLVQLLQNAEPHLDHGVLKAHPLTHRGHQPFVVGGMVGHARRAQLQIYLLR